MCVVWLEKKNRMATKLREMENEEGMASHVISDDLDSTKALGPGQLNLDAKRSVESKYLRR